MNYIFSPVVYFKFSVDLDLKGKESSNLIEIRFRFLKMKFDVPGWNIFSVLVEHFMYLILYHICRDN